MRRGSLLNLFEDYAPKASGHDCECRNCNGNEKCCGKPNHKGRGNSSIASAKALSRYEDHAFSISSGFFDDYEPIKLTWKDNYTYGYEYEDDYDGNEYETEDNAHAYSYSVEGEATFAQSYPSEPNTEEPYYVEPFEEFVDDHDEDSMEDPGDASKSSRQTHRNASGKPVISQRPQTIQESETVSKDDFEADLRQILAGKKRYDATQGKTVDVEPPSSSRSPKAQKYAEPTPAAKPPATEKNEHQIFERIAQSMEMANAYDLGTVVLNQRFDNFDREAEHIQHNNTTSEPVSLSTTEFLDDLDQLSAPKEVLSESSSPSGPNALIPDAKQPTPIDKTGKIDNEPVCQAAQTKLSTLGAAVRELVAEQEKSGSTKTAGIRKKISDCVSKMITALPGYTKSGCCEPSLIKLEEQVKDLPWPANDPSDNDRGRLVKAIKKQQLAAREDFENC